jgi:hypothetical protein
MATYRPALIGRWFFFMLFGVLGLATVVVVVLAITGDEGFSVPFVLFWLVALGWNAYWWLFRIVYSLTLRDGALEWEAPLRRGRIPTTDLTAFRPMTLLPNVVVIKHAGGRALLVMPGKGISDLAAALRQARPDLDIRVGPVGRMGDRMPGPSAWRGDD